MFIKRDLGIKGLGFIKVLNVLEYSTLKAWIPGRPAWREVPHLPGAQKESKLEWKFSFICSFYPKWIYPGAKRCTHQYLKKSKQNSFP
jgi:hypothetical protein